MPPKREAGATASPTPIKMLKINTVPMEAGPMNLTESTYSPFLHTEDFEDLEEEASEGIRTDTISLLMKIEQLQAQLKYERRCRILAERELRQMKDIEELQQKPYYPLHHDAKTQTFQSPEVILASPLPKNTHVGLSSEVPIATTPQNKVAMQLLKDVTLQKLLQTVTELVKEVKELKEDFHSFYLSSKCGQNSQEPLPDPFNLPITSQEELDFAEAKLQSIDARKAMVSRLSLVGGTTLEVRVRWMLRTTLSNELASQLNWAGKMAKVEAKQKRAFKDTNLCKIIYDSLKRQMGMEASEYEFAAVVKKWLRYAPDRVGGKGRSESCQTEEEA
ncbi:uncharacterized protein LOC130922003 isoform X2 [Corythoichthys intestinalis]|uniref:uncharacterized protein LOC130922003 isoform X2 n=1 Tax=Corythoichthys intestinalis TaxID=161448 RepID=UPI0025A5CB5D|nr:uncharacterized protein LOC130922003 isoform X2 [Corythoichthys intestinalis]